MENTTCVMRHITEFWFIILCSLYGGDLIILFVKTIIDVHQAFISVPQQTQINSNFRASELLYGV